MPRFVFQLQPVLKHRTRIERERQVALAAVQGEMLRLQLQLKELNEQMQQSTADLRENHLVGRLSVDYLLAHRRFVLGMQGKAQGLVQRMALVQRQIDEARAALAEAAKQRKIMEKLRERHFERWRAALGASEAKEMDEIGTQLAFRNLTAAPNF